MSDTQQTCTRLDCKEEAAYQITLETGEKTTVYRMCHWHYLECLSVIQGVQVITGVGELRHE